MIRILLDHNIPVGLRLLLAPHDVSTAYDMGWDELANGSLLTVASSSAFDAW